MIRGLALLAVVAAIYGVGFVSAWKWHSGECAKYREQQALDALVDQAHVMAQRDKLQSKLEALDAEHTEERQQAEKREQRLLADVESGRQRLSVLIRQCGSREAAGTTSVDDGTVRAELDPAHGARVIRITRDGDRAIRALNGLQDYVRQVCLADGM